MNLDFDGIATEPSAVSLRPINSELARIARSNGRQRRPGRARQLPGT